VIISPSLASPLPACSVRRSSHSAKNAQSSGVPSATQECTTRIAERPAYVSSELMSVEFALRLRVVWMWLWTTLAIKCVSSAIRLNTIRPPSTTYAYASAAYPLTVSAQLSMGALLPFSMLISPPAAYSATFQEDCCPNPSAIYVCALASTSWPMAAACRYAEMAFTSACMNAMMVI
jgi:hypothetical protein